GGAAGSLGAFVRNPGTDAETVLPSTSSSTALVRGDVLRIITPGGGGFGDPRERDRERVKRDVDEGKVSADRARTDYGFNSSRHGP
ncbi:MAG: hydantoinase B/oxoprolinase family protein, partial [Gemmatimonadaceae bacterium]|nr:hydantoinase B/oxoprolinase family protein [Gemmatimonadaceae bacterium]